MDEDSIGTSAGMVWRVLDLKGKATRYQLINETELKAPEIDAAVGWLSKENKIHRNGEFFSLEQTNMDKTIGFNAKIVFKVLKEVPFSVSTLHKITELNAIEIHQAIGWLTKEGNINLTSEPIIQEILDENENTLQFLKNEVEILNNDVENRNEIICQLSRQLTDRQTQFIEQAHMIDQFNDKLEKRGAIVSLRNLDVLEKNDQIMRLEQDIKSFNDDIFSRNQIITDLSKQLTKTQMESIKQTHAFEQLQKQMVDRKVQIKPIAHTSIQERISHVSTVQNALESESEIRSFDTESRLYNSKSPVLDISENQDIEPVFTHPKTIDEIHQTIDQVIFEKINKLKQQ